MNQLHLQERAAIGVVLPTAVIGGADTFAQVCKPCAQSALADEFVLVCDVFDPALRLRSLDIATTVCGAG